jgi:hypothetical protein
MNQHNNPMWPFPIHNGVRTAASERLLSNANRTKYLSKSLDSVLESDPVVDTRLEEDAIF